MDDIENIKDAKELKPAKRKTKAQKVAIAETEALAEPQPLDLYVEPSFDPTLIPSKILLLNAFNKLLNLRIGAKGTKDPLAAAWINDVFHDWVIGLMNSILAESTQVGHAPEPEALFSDEEIVTLKALAASVRQRSNAAATPKAQPQATPPQNQPRHQPQSPVHATLPDTGKLAVEQEAWLRKLAKMDAQFNP